MAGINVLPNKPVEGRRGPRIDAHLLLATLLLLVAGFTALYSEGMARDGLASFRKQLINCVIGLVPFGIFATVNPRVWQRLAKPMYIVNLLLLMVVLLKGKTAKGAERWIDIGPMQFQPSELAKILIVITLASFYASRQDQIQTRSTYLLGLVHALVPALLILKQPHLGAFSVVMVAWFAISVVANVPIKYLASTFAVVAVIAGGLFAAPGLRNRLLNPYQVDRVEALLATLSNSGDSDKRGKNWQTDRAEIAFGVGSVTGTGFGNGQQKAGHFIPEQRNDFIFTVIGEEGGLVGCTLVLAAFGFFFYRVFLIILGATEPYYRMIAAGIFSVLGFHMFVNIAMVLHIIPVVGLWLPFLSYGGTALWLCMACVGMLLNIHRREKPLLF